MNPDPRVAALLEQPWTIGSGEGCHNPATLFAGADAICQIYGAPLHCQLADWEALARDKPDSEWARGLAIARLLAAVPDLVRVAGEIYRRDDRPRYHPQLWEALKKAGLL